VLSWEGGGGDRGGSLHSKRFHRLFRTFEASLAFWPGENWGGGKICSKRAEKYGIAFHAGHAALGKGGGD